jgi:hypothetical protein
VTPKVSAWWVVAAAATPMAIDFAFEPAWRFVAFVVYCFVLSPLVFLFWAAATGRLHES